MDEAALSGAAGAPVRVLSRALLSGGAIQQNWLLEVERGGAREDWVLRTDNAATLAVSLTRPQEFALLRAAHAAGVPVPEPLFEGEHDGKPFFVMRRVRGTANAVALGKQVGPGGDAALVRDCGKALRSIHSIEPPRPDLRFLGEPPADPALAFVAAMEQRLDDTGTPRPVVEWGLAAMRRHAPPPLPPVLLHRDFRNGNLMVEEGRLTGVLDWEFCGWGDPHEDLGWFCAPCWRFAHRHLEAGGLGPRKAFLEAYGARVDAARLPYWELGATIRWAVIASDQGARFLSGVERSLELALTGHIVPALEMDILKQVEGLDAGTA